jgi:hypothetical protein
MSRYQPLADFLAGKKALEWEASFEEIESQLGFPLPESAHKYPAWWANQSGPGHSQTKGWRGAGWKTAGLDLERKRVRFEREVHVVPANARQVDEGDDLMRKARELTGIVDREALVAEALRALVAREAAARLARLGGTMPGFRAPERRRSGS